MILKIGIVGSRRRDKWLDKKLIGEKILEISLANPDHVIQFVSGGCPLGADRMAEEFQIELDMPLPIILHLPDKSKLDPELMKKNPRAAYAVINYARNTLIAKDSDHLIACNVLGSPGGTDDTIRKFNKLGKKEFLHLV